MLTADMICWGTITDLYQRGGLQTLATTMTLSTAAFTNHSSAFIYIQAKNIGVCCFASNANLDEHATHNKDNCTFSPSGLLNKSDRGEDMRLAKPRRLQVMSKRRLICHA